MEFDELREIPVVTIYKNGCIAFNVVFDDIITPFEAYKKRLEILYLKERNIIAFRFIKVKYKYPEFSYKPCLYPFCFNPHGFISKYKLDIKQIKGKYLPKQINTKHGSIWTIDLNKKLRIELQGD